MQRIKKTTAMTYYIEKNGRLQEVAKTTFYNQKRKSYKRETIHTNNNQIVARRLTV